VTAVVRAVLGVDAVLAAFAVPVALLVHAVPAFLWACAAVAVYEVRAVFSLPVLFFPARWLLINEL